MNTSINRTIPQNRFFFSIVMTVLGIVILSVMSCVSAPHQTKKSPEMSPAPIKQPPQYTPLTFVFSGDLMAHFENFRQEPYGEQYAAIEPLLKNCDASFTNLEFVIDNTKEYATYPRFNVQIPYVQAAADAGFSVFSLANNHTADWYNDGITQTEASVGILKESAQKKGKELIFSGLKKSEDTQFIPEIFMVKNTRIVFLAVTEILNDYSSGRNRINLLEYTKKGRKDFTANIMQIKETYKPDILILSIHIAEPEYVREVAAVRKEYFRTLAEAGADIIWANHPHVALPWEYYTAADGRQTLIMYSLGNLISGQRYTPNIANPAAPREYTGDTILLSVTLSPSGDTFLPYALNAVPHLYTTYVDKKDGTISLKAFTHDFIASCSSPLQDYYKKRFELMHEYLPLHPKTLPAAETQPGVTTP